MVTASGAATAGATEASSSRVARRHAAVRREILDAARELMRVEGVGQVSLRRIADAVDLKAPSLYSYFPSKAALYDVLFADGYRELDAAIAAVDRTGDRTRDLTATFHAFLAFCLADHARYQLLFTRVLPGWAPSAEAYAVSVASYEGLVEGFAALGIDDPAALDLWTAITAGFAAQQVANDPDGDRWLRLVDDAVALFVAHLEATP